MQDERATTKAPRAKAQRSRRRRVIETAVVVTVVAGAALLSVTMLGNSASSKFDSVGSAICDRRVDDGLPRWPRGAAVTPGVLGVVTGMPDCGAMAPSAGGGVAAGARPGGPPVSAAATPPGATAPPGNASPASFAANALDAPAPGGPAAAGHAFVSTATMTVRVEGDTATAVAEQKRQAMTIAANVGGGLFGEQSTFRGNAQAVITLKVPSAEFVGVLNALAALGEVQTQDVKTDEVTLQVIDLDARIKAAEAGLERTRGLIARSSNVIDIAQLETDAGRRQAEVENLKGQQIALADRVALSTIVLTLVSSDPVIAAPAPPPPPEPQPLPGFADGLTGGWSVFTTVGTVVLAAVGASLPFLPFVIVALIVWRVARHRSSTRSGVTPRATATASR